VIARPSSGASTENFVVQQFTLVGDEWLSGESAISISFPTGKKFFAPANVRAAKDNPAYAELVAYWMREQYTLRYSGGLVPDVHHMLVKVGACHGDCAIIIFLR